MSIQKGDVVEYRCLDEYCDTLHPDEDRGVVLEVGAEDYYLVEWYDGVQTFEIIPIANEEFQVVKVEE